VNGGLDCYDKQFVVLIQRLLKLHAIRQLDRFSHQSACPLQDQIMRGKVAATKLLLAQLLWAVVTTAQLHGSD
jgi:hypothetical protein